MLLAALAASRSHDNQLSVHRKEKPSYIMAQKHFTYPVHRPLLTPVFPVLVGFIILWVLFLPLLFIANRTAKPRRNSLIYVGVILGICAVVLLCSAPFLAQRRSGKVLFRSNPQ